MDSEDRDARRHADDERSPLSAGAGAPRNPVSDGPRNPLSEVERNPVPPRNPVSDDARNPVSDGPRKPVSEGPRKPLGDGPWKPASDAVACAFDSRAAASTGAGCERTGAARSAPLSAKPRDAAWPPLIPRSAPEPAAGDALAGAADGAGAEE